MTEWDADRDRAFEEDGYIIEAERERLRLDLLDLQKRYGPPQPRDPQEGQLALPIDGGDGDEQATPEGASE